MILLHLNLLYWRHERKRQGKKNNGEFRKGDESNVKLCPWFSASNQCNLKRKRMIRLEINSSEAMSENLIAEVQSTERNIETKDYYVYVSHTSILAD